MKLKFIICGIAAIAATGFQASADVLTDAFEAVKSIGGAMIVDTPEQQLQEKGIDAATVAIFQEATASSEAATDSICNAIPAEYSIADVNDDEANVKVFKVDNGEKSRMLVYVNGMENGKKMIVVVLMEGNKESLEVNMDGGNFSIGKLKN